MAVSPTSNQIAVSINGTSGLSLSTTNSSAGFARTNLEATHSWRWIKGRRNMGWGVDIMFSRHSEYNYYQGWGAYGFKGRFTGLDQADFLLGLMSSFFQSNGEIEFRRHHYRGFCFNDSFRLGRRLTLNCGVRWEPCTPITGLNDRQVQFRPEEYLKGTKSARYLNAPAGLFYPGDTKGGETINKSGVTAGKKQFAPRIGPAWDVTGEGSISLRAGYGIYYDTPMMYLLNNMNLQAPFSFSVGFTDGGFDNPYQGRQNLNLFPFSGDFAKPPFHVPMSAIVYPSRWRQPCTQNWSLTLERRPMRQFQDTAMLFTGLNSIYNGLQMRDLQQHPGLLRRRLESVQLQNDARPLARPGTQPQRPARPGRLGHRRQHDPDHPPGVHPREHEHDVPRGVLQPAQPPADGRPRGAPGPRHHRHHPNRDRPKSVTVRPEDRLPRTASMTATPSRFAGPIPR